MLLEPILEKAEAMEGEVAELTSRLVQYNTAHPDGFTDMIVEFIKSYFDGHGIYNEIHAKEDKKPNIMARINGTSEKKILWLGHLDVVPEGNPEDWTYPPYSGTLSDDCVHGRGSSDMKGACAAAMISANILNEQEEVSNTVEFWFTSDEEIGGGAGAKWLSLSNNLKGDVCIIGDGNGGGYSYPSIDLGCKGGAQIKLSAKGSTAHGSTPYLGDNAINKLIKAIPWVEKIDDYELDFPETLIPVIESSVDYYKGATPLSEKQLQSMRHNFYTPSVTCNMIQGGVKINMVPDHAECQFDIRLTPGSTTGKVYSEIHRLVELSGIEGVTVEPLRELSGPDDTAGYFESPRSDFCKQFRGLINEVTGKPVNMKILTGGTDGVSTSRIAGIPSLGYGTSLTGQAHQPNEHITTENLVLGIKIYTSFPLIYK